jgi:hypothetical protein
MVPMKHNSGEDVSLASLGNIGCRTGSTLMYEKKMQITEEHRTHG